MKLSRVAGFVACAALGLGCDASTHGRDASAPLAQRVSEVSVRIDAPGGGSPAISVLAFRAAVSGLAPSDVLGVVDPLVAPPPDARGCEVRDVAAAARNLRAQGGGVELEELANVSLALGVGEEAQALGLAPRVYPQLASAVGGVIDEVGPVDLLSLPETVTVKLPPSDSAAPIRLDVPGVPHLVGAAGEPLSASTRFDPAADVTLSVTGPARSFVEIRPFGASTALACPVGAGGRVTVPRELLDRVVPQTGRVPVSFEAVWRDSRFVQLASGTAHLSLEARSSMALDVRGVTAAAEPPRAAPPASP